MFREAFIGRTQVLSKDRVYPEDGACGGLCAIELSSNYQVNSADLTDVQGTNN